MKAGPKENLIRVDVPDPGNHLLVHQEGFNPPTSLMQNPHKILLRCREGIHSKSAGEIPIQSGFIQ